MKLLLGQNAVKARANLGAAALEAKVEELKHAGLSFRYEIVTDPGGKQILLEDPAGNVVELFEPA